MSKLLVLLIFIFTGIWISSCAHQDFTIGIIGDQFGSYDTDKSYEIMQTAVNKVEIHNPDILLHVGDIVESIRGIESFEDYKSNYKHATEIMNNSQLPWILAIGDHGVVPPGFQANSNDRSREEWFLRCSQIFSTPIDNATYYSLDVDGYHFISLYSLENLHTDPRWGSIFLNKISSEQVSWLKSDLEKHKKSKGIVVVVHHPMWYVWSNWMEVHNLLKEYQVIAVIAGHYHYDQDEGVIDGIRYLVMGSSGGVVKDSDANTGGVQEYGVMKLKNSKIEDLKLYEVYSDSLLEWTPRISMDRVQAISCMLDNLWNEIQFIKKEDKIYSIGKDSELSDKLEISSLVNPIDIPIEIIITYNDSIISNAIWYSNDSPIIEKESIILNPGERVGWANYTSVGQWFTPPTIWEAELIQNNTNVKNITLSFIIKFKDTKPRVVNRSISYAVN